MALVDYLVARDGLPPRRGLGYDYVLAGDGLYLVAENEALSIRVPVARCAVRGLPPLYPACTLKHGRLPHAAWETIVAIVEARSLGGREVLVVATRDEMVGYRLVRPPQLAGPTGVIYEPPSNAVLEIHSHCEYPARFSPTDDRDEQGLRVYGVLGRLGTERPEVALRVGAYGHYLPLPWEAVFAGDRGAFRDAQVEPATETEGTDELPD